MFLKVLKNMFVNMNNEHMSIVSLSSLDEWRSNGVELAHFSAVTVVAAFTYFSLFYKWIWMQFVWTRRDSVAQLIVVIYRCVQLVQMRRMENDSTPKSIHLILHN